MVTIIFVIGELLKELRNCILRIIRMWSVFCSGQVYISLHLLPILLVKPGFRLFFFSVSLAFNF